MAIVHRPDHPVKRTRHHPALMQRTAHSFETMRPGALAAWLMTEHSFVEQTPLGSEAYRLTTAGMVVAIFPYGLVLCEGRQPDAAALLLHDLSIEEGGGM